MVVTAARSRSATAPIISSVSLGRTPVHVGQRQRRQARHGDVVGYVCTIFCVLPSWRRHAPVLRHVCHPADPYFHSPGMYRPTIVRHQPCDNQAQLLANGVCRTAHSKAAREWGRRQKGRQSRTCQGGRHVTSDIDFPRLSCRDMRR